MEQNIEMMKMESQPEVATIKSKPLILQPLFILVLAVVVAVAAGVAILFSQNASLRNQLDEQTQELSASKSTIESLKGELTEVKLISDKISTIDSRVTAAAKMAYISYIQHEIEGGVVTDDFVVDKVYLIPNSSGDKITILINVDTQPSMSAFYQGKGSFSLGDRELRAKSIELIENVKERYESSSDGILPTWDDSNVTLTIKNYDIGDTLSGEFKLVGEK